MEYSIFFNEITIIKDGDDRQKVSKPVACVSSGWKPLSGFTGFTTNWEHQVGLIQLLWVILGAIVSHILVMIFHHQAGLPGATVSCI